MQIVGNKKSHTDNNNDPLCHHPEIEYLKTFLFCLSLYFVLLFFNMHLYIHIEFAGLATLLKDTVPDLFFKF